MGTEGAARLFLFKGFCSKSSSSSTSSGSDSGVASGLGTLHRSGVRGSGGREWLEAVFEFLEDEEKEEVEEEEDVASTAARLRSAILFIVFGPNWSVLDSLGFLREKVSNEKSL